MRAGKVTPALFVRAGATLKAVGGAMVHLPALYDDLVET